MQGYLDANNRKKRTLSEAAADSNLQGGRGWLYTNRYTAYYAQEYDYSCGPACARMALKNITGTIYTEAYARYGCNCTPDGTYISDIAFFLNETILDTMEEEYFYIAKYNQTQATMVNDLYASIVQTDILLLIQGIFINENQNTYCCFRLVAACVM